MKKRTRIIKASGEEAVFITKKLRNSLQKAGASPGTVQKIIRLVENRLYEGMTTKEIYKLAFAELRKTAKHTAARYRLKNALLELGPSGYPFEKYVGELFRYQGYKVRVGVNVPGHCVNHEVDVVGEKENKLLFAECKFHNRAGYKCDVKVPLYIHSRFRDIFKKKNKSANARNLKMEGWLVTNTHFSDDAIRYGNCAGLHLLGWSYPGKGSLKNWIDHSGLHPVTCLTTITKKEKKHLLDKSVILSRDLVHNEKLLNEVDIDFKRAKKILAEVRDLCLIKS